MTYLWYYHVISLVTYRMALCVIATYDLDTTIINRTTLSF